ncbi:DUF4296 domain-containing protein [Pedobacter nototheniae]|uniref:DUF4296 domain-containing protein n=1 Tax=Pedobacter nototheniae TaxID=2488994 RepID=UPI00292DEC40|nr:DUF4296 domain-containing protein [Pedobacter nototheniae]
MRRLIWALSIAILWLGCKPGIPNDVIKPDKMEKILYDIHVADGYVSTIYVTDSAKKVAASFYKGIYKKFGIDSAQYSKSMAYYNAHTDDLGKIYKNISKRLEWQKNKMQKIASAKLSELTEVKPILAEDKPVRNLKKAPKKAKKAKKAATLKIKPERVNVQ